MEGYSYSLSIFTYLYPNFSWMGGKDEELYISPAPACSLWVPQERWAQGLIHQVMRRGKNDGSKIERWMFKQMLPQRDRAKLSMHWL